MHPIQLVTGVIKMVVMDMTRFKAEKNFVFSTEW